MLLARARRRRDRACARALPRPWRACRGACRDRRARSRSARPRPGATAGIGAGRAPIARLAQRRSRDWVQRQRGARSSGKRTAARASVALIDRDDYAFVVNGKVDGSARGDAGTQVMGGPGRRAAPSASARARSSSASAPAARPAGSARSRRWSASTSSSSSRPSCASRAAARRSTTTCSHNPKVHIAHRRRARGAARRARPLRPHLLRAVESVPRRHRQPLHARVLPRGRRRGSTAAASSCSGCRPTRSTRRRSGRSTRRSARVFPHVETWQTDERRPAARRDAAADRASTSSALRARLRQEPFRTRAARTPGASRRSEGFLGALRRARHARSTRIAHRARRSSTPTTARRSSSASRAASAARSAST